MSLSSKRCILAEHAFQAFKYEATPEEIKKWKIAIETDSGTHFINTGREKQQIKRGDIIVQDFWGILEVMSEAKFKERYKEVCHGHC